jgi:hypothetical protein
MYVVRCTVAPHLDVCTLDISSKYYTDRFDITCLRPDPRCIIPDFGKYIYQGVIFLEKRWSIDYIEYLLPTKLYMNGTMFINVRDTF